MNRFIVCIAFVLPLLLAVAIFAPAAHANGRHGHHHRHVRRAATAPATQTVAVNGQQQAMVPALGTTRLLRRPGEMLTDVVSRLSDVACNVDTMNAIALDGRIVLCVDRDVTNEATAAVGQLIDLRTELEHQSTMGSETADAITLAIALVDTVLAAREHHHHGGHHGQHRNLFASRR